VLSGVSSEPFFLTLDVIGKKGINMKNRWFFLLLAMAVTVLVFCGCKGKSKPMKNLPGYLSKFSSGRFGQNVFVFDPSMDMKEIQTAIDSIYQWQISRNSEFSDNRFALFFKPGHYTLDVKLGYYMQVAGLGRSPDDVIIEGNVRSLTTRHGNVLINFWRSVENITVIPFPDSSVTWGVSQASPMRRMHIKGNLNLFDKGYASGGFIADCRIDGRIASGPQQQWFTRNSEMAGWEGGVWNMTFVGVKGAPDSDFPDNPYTTIERTPVIREKPFLVYEGKSFYVMLSSLRQNSSGAEWTGGTETGRKISLKEFYIAFPGTDNSGSLNMALDKGKHLFFTPGRYFLKESLKVTKPGTVVMGTGMATLIPDNGNAAVDIDDIDGVTVCGLTIDAGKTKSEKLFEIGEARSGISHRANPVFLYDIFFRVGGPSEGSASSCMVVNSNDVVIDHIWLWRADHGNGVGWDKNRCANGLIVNGDNITIYGLFNEHFQEYQTLWNGNNGRVFFYQSEMPYDPPSPDAWKHGDSFGYASYKVSENVTSHEAWGLGIYNVFYDAPVIVDNAIETPEAIESGIHNKVIFWLNGNKESVVRSIINGKGGQVDINNRKSAMK
jgi:hypothetical protein